MSISATVQGSEEVTVPPTIPSCIFCFKNCVLHPNENIKVIQNRFFKLVDRYFDYRIFSEWSSRKGDDGNNYFEGLAFPHEELKTGCCLDCFNVITSYCEVYHRMKCLEMELDGMLDKLMNVMKYADRVPARISGFRDWCLMERVNMEKEMQFRKKFQNNCKLSSTRSFPRLTLKRKVNGGLDPCATPPESQGNTLSSPPAKSPPNLVISSVCSLQSQPPSQPSTEPVHYAGLEVPEEIFDTPADDFPSPPASPEPEVAEPEPKRSRISSLSDHPKDNTDNDHNGDVIEAVDCVDDGDNQEESEKLTPPPPLAIPVPPPVIPELFTWTCFKCPCNPQPCFSSFAHLQVHQNYLHTSGLHKMTKQEFTEVLQLNRQNIKLKRKDTLSPSGTLVKCCPICQFVFKKVVSRVPLMHYVNYHDLTRLKDPFTCKRANCSAYFLTKEQLKQHLRNAHVTNMVKKKKKERSFNCGKCEKVFKHLNALKRHKLLDCGITEKKMEEYEEIKLSSRPGGMKIKDFINGKRKSCPICKKRVNCGRARKTWIITHYFEYHDKTEMDMHNCKKCKAYFRNAFQLENHLKEIHGINSHKFACVDCGLVCKDFTKLRIHRKGVHKLDEEVFQFVCDFAECGRRFETEVEMGYHKRGAHTEEGGMQMCTVCGKSCTGSGALKNHMKRHEEEDKGEDKHICEQCGKIFETKQKLSRHGESHKAKNGMKFVCEICGKVCLNGNKLREHGRTHGKEKPFVCQICGLAYAHGHNLRIHVRKMHEEFKHE